MWPAKAYYRGLNALWAALDVQSSHYTDCAISDVKKEEGWQYFKVLSQHLLQEMRKPVTNIRMAGSHQNWKPSILVFVAPTHI